MIFHACTSVSAAEGTSLAGPIGGTDLRSALLPPPGLYGGAFLFGAEAFDFRNGQGQTVPALRELHLTKVGTAPFLVYVPDLKVLGGSVGVAATVRYERLCGHLSPANPTPCGTGFGDPYIEVGWSRSFTKPRPSRFAGAPPIPEGLTIAAGFGVVVPVGRYDASNPTTRAKSNGSNIWDLAPSVAFTYMSAPIFVEGTEISAKLYWNNYLTNPTTNYSTGSLLNVDFAVTERIGRFQVGAAGSYLVQIADDKQFGTAIPPDGRRAEALMLGGVVVYDMPEYGAAIKLKATATVADVAANHVNAHALVFAVFKKLQ